MDRKKIRIAIAQINPTVGDLEGNSHKILQYIRRADGFGINIICFPELSLTGYPPEDLLLKPKFVEDNLKAIREIAKEVSSLVAIVGFVDKKGKFIYNAAAVMQGKRIRAVYHKILLPNYGVFDEKRYFSSGKDASVFCFNGIRFAVNICEDIWHNQGPMKEQVKRGAKLIFNISASPYHLSKLAQREKTLKSAAKINRVFIIYVNLVGGQDELVFDGQSMVVDKKGRLLRKMSAFKEDFCITDINMQGGQENIGGSEIIHKGIEAEVYGALILGLKDYVRKNGFKKVVIGLSGGIDSSLVATLATDTLGKENVFGVYMPSRYSSSDSEEDAARLSQNLGIRLIRVSIEQIFKMYLMVLESQFLGSQRDVTEENLQARIRGNILMALSNKFGWLVLTTGNKSEMSTGYATLYGDMAGGLAVIKDVPKILVYRLTRYRNSLSPVVPERVLSKEPAAELKPNQKDSDSLPAYEKLDPILKAYIEEDKSLNRIVSLGFDKGTVMKVLDMVDKSEYKRRQSPPGIKITPKAFGRDRRMPITNKYRG
jgi:NAD+ synthase (glutamine-hydrolysing)